MYQDTITLFVRQTGTTDDTWYPFVLEGVNVNESRGAVLQVMGQDSQDNCVLNVRYTTQDGVKYIGEYEYTDPKAWTTGKITFQDGADFGFFWIGEWTGTAVSDADYTDSFFDYMKLTYDHVYAITSVSYFSVIPHFEITGR